jgi:hypothetical protein
MTSVVPGAPVFVIVMSKEPRQPNDAVDGTTLISAPVVGVGGLAVGVLVGVGVGGLAVGVLVGVGELRVGVLVTDGMSVSVGVACATAWLVNAPNAKAANTAYSEYPTACTPPS